MALFAKKALHGSVAFLTFLSFLSPALTPSLLRAQVQNAAQSEYRPGELLVQIAGEHAPIKLTFESTASLTDIAEQYRAVEGVTYAEPNYVYRLAAFDPNDAYYADQWYLRHIGLPSAWESSTGSPDVIVAVLDTGVDINHQDLKDNIWTNPAEIPDDKIDNDTNGYIDDVHGWDFIDGTNDARPSAVPPYSRTALHHGTVVSGVIGAVGNNQQGVAGVTWRTRIMPLRVLDSEGKGDVDQVAKAVEYAARNGARVINLSFVGHGFSQRLYDALRQAYLSGVLIVTAAGNVDEQPGSNGDLDTSPMYPVCYDAADNTGQNWILGVTATDLLDQHLPTSNYGSRCVDIAAPGASFTGTQVYDPRFGLNDRYGGSWSGTSLAAPVVAGVAALLFTAHPEFSHAQVISAIQSTADDITSLNRTYAGKLGKGRINAARAIRVGSPGAPTTATGVTGQIVLLPNGFRSLNAELVTPTGEKKKSWAVVQRDFRAGGEVAVSEDARTEVNDSRVRISSILRGEQNIVFSEGVGGRGLLRVYDVHGQLQREWLAFDRPFGGGVSVASGDVFGNGEASVIVMAQSGGGPQVRVFNRQGKVLQQFFAYETSLRGGFDVAVADVTGDGKAEIITASLSRELPIRVYRPDGTLLTEWRALGPYGVRVSAGDLEGDGVSEVVLTSLRPGSSTVGIYSGQGVVRGLFSALPKGFRSNVTVATGDVNGDGVDEIITGPTAAGGPQVRIFDNRARLLGQFFAYDARLRGGMALSVLR